MLIALLAALVVFSGACSNEVEQETADAGETPGNIQPIQRDGGGDAARARGIAVVEEETEGDVEPEVLLGTLEYEWRESPERGLRVEARFVNPNVTYERARGYVFFVASSSLDGASGVYPWNAGLRDGEPEDHRDGAHLLYRDDQTVSAFLPYRGGVGYYDRLKVLVYDEDGEVLIGQTYELEVDGTASGPKEMKPKLVL
jgi:hypothetical protein